MVLILDGNSEIGAHVWSNLCYLICLRHLIRSKTVTNLIFPIFLHACATCSKLPSDISNMDGSIYLESEFEGGAAGAGWPQTVSPISYNK